MSQANQVSATQVDKNSSKLKTPFVISIMLHESVLENMLENFLMTDI